MKNLYIELTTLLDTITEVKHIDLYQNQDEDDGQDLPFSTPSVFLEFRSNDMSDIAQNAQSINMQIDVIVMVETFADSFQGSTNQSSALEFLDIMEKVHAKLHGSDGTNYGGMERIGYNPNALTTSRLSYRMIYQCHTIDESAARTFEEVTSDLDIERGEQAESDVPPEFDYE